MDERMTGLAALSGHALDEALARKFDLATIDVAVVNRTYTLRKPANADHLITEADYVMDERLPYWADLWPAARALATALLAEAGSGRTLLEMGCGLGLATIAAMDAGFEVTATDYYEDALHVARANAARNVGSEPAVRMVNWRDWPTDLGRFDVVVAADVLYEREYAALVARCIATALAANGEAIVADPGRLALPEFLDGLGAHGLVLASREQVAVEDGASMRDVAILRIRHAA